MNVANAVQTLVALNARFIHNYVTNDVRSHDEITHRDFICITTKGVREQKAAYLQRWATGFDPSVIVHFDYRDESISVFGPVALVRAVTKQTVIRGESEVTSMTTYTDTYVLENGRWLCVQAQLTPVSPEHYPDDRTIVKKYISGVAA